MIQDILSCCPPSLATTLIEQSIDDLLNQSHEKRHSAEHFSAIIVHCGVTDLKTANPTDASRLYVSSIKNVVKKYPNTKIVISKIPYCKGSSCLLAKRDLFNALIFSEQMGIQTVSFDAHETMYASAYRE